MKHIAKKRIFEVEPYRPGKPIAEVKRELKLSKVIKLASNENPYGPASSVLKAMIQEAGLVNRYPDGGCFYLRQALAKKLSVGGENLIFGNGSDEIIVMAIRAFVSQGDEVIIAKPSFLIYDIAARLEGAVIKAVPLKNFYYDLDGMKREITPKTKIVFIGNPDNPAGTFVNEKNLVDFLKKIRKDILVFIDEAYFEFVNDKSYPDAIRLIKKYKNVIVTRTFSKMYGLAGLRLGYGIADVDVISILNRLREPFNVNSIAQAAAVACLNDKTYYRRIGREVVVERTKLYRELKKMGLGYVETATNFILVDVKNDSTMVANQLLKKGVIVRDMAFWGLRNYLRVSIGTPSENAAFVRTLKTVLS
ncbi:MAG: histidinol-phosphate transaminase [Candidatus Omnitrophica bacterium]|nr:histidinol-phosphate transaminase [Candidatus Omnitrophota bacterium]